MKKLIISIMFVLLLSSVMVFEGTSNDVFASTSTKSTSGEELTPKLDTNVGKFGYVDKKGKWIIDPQFMEAKDFSDGLAIVRYVNDSEGPKIGYIDSKGKAAFKDRFYFGYDFKKGYAIVLTKGDKVSIINKKGKVVLKTDYYCYSPEPEVDGILAEICINPLYRGDLETKVGYITADLKVVKPMFDGGISYYTDPQSKECFLEGVHSEKTSDNKGTKLTRYLINTKMEPIKLSSDFIISIKEGMVLLKCDTYYAFVNSKGEIFDEIYDSSTGEKYKFDRAESFSEGHAVVQIDNLITDTYGQKVAGYGYINKDGSTFTEPVYLSASSFSGGLASVQLAPRSSYGMAILKSNGKYLVSPPTRTTIKISEKYKEYFTESLYTQGEYDYVMSEVKKIVNQVTNSNMNTQEKISALHKYVIDHARYGGNMYYDPTPKGLWYCHEAIGILKDGEGVCDAYSKLTGLLLTEAGIENVLVGGTVGKASHEWNLVKIDENYYHLDPTFNDGDKKYNYYLVSDIYLKSLKGVLKREWNYSDFPAASKGYYNDQPQSK